MRSSEARRSSLSERSEPIRPELVSVSSLATTSTGVGSAVLAVLGLKRSCGEVSVGGSFVLACSSSCVWPCCSRPCLPTHSLRERDTGLASPVELSTPLGAALDGGVGDGLGSEAELAEASENVAVGDGGHNVERVREGTLGCFWCRNGLRVESRVRRVEKGAVMSEEGGRGGCDAGLSSCCSEEDAREWAIEHVLV